MLTKRNQVQFITKYILSLFSDMQNSANTPSTLERAFLKACKHDDLVTVRDCIEHGVNVNVKTASGNHFGLLYAVEYNNTKLCDLLLAHPDIDVNNRTQSFNMTPLMMSCIQNDVDISKKLVDTSGIDLNQRDINGRTAAMIAAASDNPNCTKLLAEVRGVDWNILDVNGDTAVMQAAKFHQVENLRILSNVDGIDWNLQNFSGLTPAMLSMKYGYSDSVRVLAGIDDVDWNIRGMMDETAVSLAMNHFYTHCLKVLAQYRHPQDVDWNVHDYTAYFMVSIVAARGDYELLEILSRIESINWNIKGTYGQVLKFALTLEDTSQRSRIVQILLSIPDLDLNIEEVFHELNEAAVHECKLYILGVMSADENLQEREDITELVYVVINNLERFQKILASAPGAAEECRNYIRGVMARDETLPPESNLTELVYALVKNLDKFVQILATDLRTCDILCLILHSKL